MKLVQKENRQLRIPDEKLPVMLARGYTEVKMAAVHPAASPSGKTKPRRKGSKSCSP